MNCRHCHHWNAEDELRCRLCGRKLRFTGNDTTSEWALNTVRGNLAAAPQKAPQPREAAATASGASVAGQRSLFAERHASNVIPFDVLTGMRPATQEAPVPERALQASPRPQPKPVPAAKRAAIRRTADQRQLDFLPPSVAPRTLKTSVQAVIFCDAPVATLPHRSFACAIDFSLILIGYGLCLTAYAVMGGGFSGTRSGYLTFAGAFVLLALFYGLLWTLAKTETPGMRWTSLKLTNFDGFAPDPGQRALRFFATALSFACAFGLLWALVDEESLTWQDHISKTFPTFHRPE